MARTTVKQMESALSIARRAGIAAGAPHAESWELDYAPIYGGAAVSVKGGSATLGEACMSANRIPPAEFVRAMRILADVLEDMAPVGDTGDWCPICKARGDHRLSCPARWAA